MKWEKIGKNVQGQKKYSGYMYHCMSLLEEEFCNYNSESMVWCTVETIFLV